MRLSLMKAARAVTDGAAHRKSGISLVFGEMWDTQTLIWVVCFQIELRGIPHLA
jgi:hypothetical protein